MHHLPKVAYFDDDPSNLRLFSQMFRDVFSLDVYQNPLMYEKVLRENYSAIIIDVIMPVMDGIELYHSIKKHKDYNQCPLIFISADEGDETKMKSLSAGGYDFFSRFMKKEEMVFRLNHEINLFEKNRTVISLGSLTIDTENLRVRVFDQILDLTMIEYKLLKLLIKNKHSVVGRDEIIGYVWGDCKVMNATLNTHVSNLRTKLCDWDCEIVSSKNKGFCIEKKNL